jgi:hypothetical protein
MPPRAGKQLSQPHDPPPLFRRGMIVPERDDHVGAAELRNDGRRRGLQIGTIDALLAQLCIRHDLMMLSTDQDFMQLARFAPLRIWPG